MIGEALPGVEINPDYPPTGGSVFYYPGARTIGGANVDGRFIRVSSSNEKFWYALCAGGMGRAEGLFQFSTDQSRFVVLFKGAGYRLSYDDPENWAALPLHGINHVLYNSASDLLMLFDWTRGIGYGPSGTVWKTPRLFLDALTIESFDDHTVTLRGYGFGVASMVTLNACDGVIVSGHPSEVN